jgi:pyruvate dehydrogenase E1 component alpha subunit
MYETMIRIRKFENLVADLVSSEKIRCPCHLYTGQEAVATGVCSALLDTDWVFSTHRSHGHYIAKGGDIRTLMAELFGKETGCSHGHGGSMHIAAPEKGLPGSSAIVAGTISLAVGAGLSFFIQNKKNVSVAFFGDGATNEGVFYESLNFAALKKLPVLFICENNLYSTHLPISQCLANTNITEIARAFHIPSYRVDGNNLPEVYGTARKCLDALREGNGPAFMECMTYRWLGHVGPNDDIDKGLRSKEELDSWIERCPIAQFEKYLMDNGILKDAGKRAISDRVDLEVQEALNFALTSPCPECNLKELRFTGYKEAR